MFILLIIVTFTAFGYAKSLVNVKVYVDNNFLELKTNKNTVLDVLKSSNIILGENDIVRPTGDTKVKDNMFIRVYRVTKQEIHEKKIIPYTTYHKYTSRLLLDKTVIEQHGKEGLKEIIAQRICIDGVSINDNIIKETILTKPINCILVKGTKKAVSLPHFDTEKSRVKEILTMVATAYSDSKISCGKWAGGPTAIGFKAQYGVVAVDPRVIPLRTKLYIEGYGYGIAGDTGSAIKGNRIDVCFNTHQEAVKYGRKTVKVYILE